MSEGGERGGKRMEEESKDVKKSEEEQEPPTLCVQCLHYPVCVCVFEVSTSSCWAVAL